jgi:hypothetical protein
MDKIKLLLDTDIGSDIDDALSLCYLLSNPECELMGITTVTGEAEKELILLIRSVWKTDAICQYTLVHLNRFRVHNASQ